MARIKPTSRKRSVPPLFTWTRFHLPREQRLPTWSVDQTPGHINVHHGPLVGVQGRKRVWLGRMVEDPEQAAYIIEWATRDDLKNFQSSPACAEFLQNLPEHGDSQVSIDSGLGLGKMTLSEASSSSSTVSRRFLLLGPIVDILRPDVEDRVTFTAFLVPGKVDSPLGLWREHFKKKFYLFTPPGYESLTFSGRTRDTFSAVWFHVLSEDGWVEKKFGKLEEQTGDDGEGGRTIICQFHLWPRQWGGTPEKEAASVADPEGRERWNQVIAQVMPPATAWVQERWDIHRILRCDPPRVEPPLEDPELERARTELCRQHARLRELGEMARESNGPTFKEDGSSHS